MFRFENPDYLYILIVIPVLVLLYIGLYFQRKKRIKLLGEYALIGQLMTGTSFWRPIIKFALLMLALACLIIMQARPQLGLELETDERKGIELMVALDISNSMMATDVAPNRLEKAKNLVSNISDKLKNDKVGLIVFAGDAFIQLPITSDLVSARMFLDAINPSMIATQGTNIGDALQLAMNSFTKQKNVQRAILIITDGEDHEGKAEEMAAEAAKNGVRVFVLGIGSEKGSTIPIEGGRDYLRDRSGNVVVTKLNTEMCKQVATAGKGVFIHVDNSNIAQDRLYYELNKMEKQDLGAVSYSNYAEHFKIFAWIALILLMLELLIDEKKNPLFGKIKLFKNNEK